MLVLLNFVPPQNGIATQTASRASDYDRINFGIDLRLGMAKDYVISSLAQNYRTQRLNVGDEGEGKSSWLIEDKSNSQQVEGALSFEHDKLTTITRYWSSTNDSNFGFGSALYRATSNFKDEHRTACLLDSGSKENPKGTSKSVFLICGAKTLEIALNDYVIDGKAVRLADIMEILGKR